MAIGKKKDSPYYYTRFCINGVRIQESTKTTCKTEAKLYEEKRKHEVREQILFGKISNKTWKDAKECWIKEMKRKRTLDQDVKRLNILQKHLDHLLLDHITQHTIHEFIQLKQQDNVKPATINRYLALIKSILNKAVKEWGWISKAPYIKLLAENNKRTRWITVEESNRLIARLPKHLALAARFTLATGLRAANIKQFQWTWIKDGFFTIPAAYFKIKKDFTAPLSDDALTVLNECRNIVLSSKTLSPYVFTYRGKRINQLNTRAFRKAVKAVGLMDFTWHDLRHTWASRHSQNGTALHEIKELGGWEDFQSVVRYSHSGKERLRSIANRINNKDLKNEAVTDCETV